MNVVAQVTQTPRAPFLAQIAAGWVARQSVHAPREAGVLEGLRRQAHRLLSIYPWPHRRFESWRHFPLRALGKIDPGQGVGGVVTGADFPEALRLLKPHGVAATVLSRGDAHCLAPGARFPEGVTARPLAPHLDALDLETLAPGARLLPRREETFAALNAALFQEGIHLRVARGRRIDAPLVIVHEAGHEAGPEAGGLFPRLRLELEEGAEATLVEIFQGGCASALTAPVTEVICAKGASLSHLRLQVEDEAASHLGTFEAVLAEGASLASRVFSLGAARSRLLLRARMEGPGASVRAEGIYLGRGQQHHEHHTWIEHAAPECRSDETYRGILDGHATAVFDGTIEVKRDAQRTESAMENRNLLLSPDAVVHTKPRLEIDADDVKCSHGATVGQLDPDQLFYLRSRGFDQEEARGLLTLAFVRALADRIPEEALRAVVLEALATRLPGVNATTLDAPENAR